MSDTELECCRYCLELFDCEEGKILNPCSCRNRVHKKCFVHWLKTRPFDPWANGNVDELNKCEICKSIYNNSVQKHVKKAMKERNVNVIRRRYNFDSCINVYYLLLIGFYNLHFHRRVDKNWIDFLLIYLVDKF